MSPAARVGGDDILRLFLALRLPGDAVEMLAAWAAESLTAASPGDGRVVPRDHLHVTLAFLGRRPARELPAIVGELRAAAAESTAHPLVPVRYRETRSVGMIVLEDASGAATRLAADLHGRLERLGVYRREAREWLPHVTVLRFRQRPRLRPALTGLAPLVPSDAAAFLSRLHPAGARYEVLEAVPLTGRRPPPEAPVGMERMR